MARDYLKKGPFQKNCLTCHLPYLAAVQNQKYCSKNCSVYKREFSNLSGGAVGALNEMRACIDLMKKGYEVFRAISPACSCDLIALKEKHALRIEVRTAQGDKSEPKFSRKPVDHGRQDYFAAVFPDTIIYIPELPNEETTFEMKDPCFATPYENT